MSHSRALADRVALVTGVSRPIGIGASIALRLHEMGATVFATGWPPHDSEMPWGSTKTEMPFAIREHNLEDAQTATTLVDEVVGDLGSIDLVVAVHARSSTQSLAELTVAEMQRSWSCNVQSILLLAQRFAASHKPAALERPPVGRMLWFTSGQHLEPMDSELGYAATKGALHQMTASLDRALSEKRIVANCINPGPVDTGWADPTTHEHIASLFPDRRWGTPANVADLVAFLVSDEGSWIRGQILNSEGGFSRFG